MFDQKHERLGVEAASERSREVLEMALLSGTILLDEDLEAVVGGGGAAGGVAESR